MYYKERWINGELHYTLSPKGSWKPFEKEDYIQRVRDLEQKVNSADLADVSSNEVAVCDSCGSHSDAGSKLFLCENCADHPFITIVN